MNSKILSGLVVMVALVAAGCNNTQDQQLPSAVQNPVQIPTAAPPGVATAPTTPTTAPVAATPVATAPVATAPTVAAPPQTTLIPVEEEKTTSSGGGTGVCKLKGPETNGDELIQNNFMCSLKVKNMPFGLNPPSFGCRVKRTGGGKLVLISTGSGNAGMTLSETKLAGFKIDGTYTFSGQKLRISSCMRAKGVGKYSGSGNGVLNGDKANRLKYTLTMTKQ